MIIIIINRQVFQVSRSVATRTWYHSDSGKRGCEKILEKKRYKGIAFTRIGGRSQTNQISRLEISMFLFNAHRCRISTADWEK